MSDQMSNEACWRMFRGTRDMCSANEIAGAVLYGAEQGWLWPDLVGSIPAEEPHASEMLRVRTAFLALAHEPDVPLDKGIAVLETVPDQWFKYTATMQLLRRVEMDANSNTFPDDTRARLLQISTRALKAEKE